MDYCTLLYGDTLVFFSIQLWSKHVKTSNCLAEIRISLYETTKLYSMTRILVGQPPYFLNTVIDVVSAQIEKCTVTCA